MEEKKTKVAKVKKEVTPETLNSDMQECIDRTNGVYKKK